MGKSRASKMRGYASLLGAKVPYKVQYDSKKCPPTEDTTGEQNNKNIKCISIIALDGGKVNG